MFVCVCGRRCFVLCECVLQYGQRGEACVRGLILCRYSFKKGEWLQRICDSVLRVRLSSCCSEGWMRGGIALVILLGCLFVRYVRTMLVWDDFMCLCMSSVLLGGWVNVRLDAYL